MRFEYAHESRWNEVNASRAGATLGRRRGDDIQHDVTRNHKPKPQSEKDVSDV